MCSTDGNNKGSVLAFKLAKSADIIPTYVKHMTQHVFGFFECFKFCTLLKIRLRFAKRSE